MKILYISHVPCMADIKFEVCHGVIGTYSNPKSIDLIGYQAIVTCDIPRL